MSSTALTLAPAPRSEAAERVRAEVREFLAAELAAAVHLSPGTTRNHLSAIMQKLDAHSRIEAIRVAEDRGWL